MVATTVFVVGVIGLAPLFILAARATSGARTTTYAAVLAQEKMEQLSDTSLSPSPGDALVRNTSGYCDFLDATGRSLGGGTTPPTTTAFVRRWSVDPLPTGPDNAVVIQVLVFRLRGSPAGLRGDAHIVSVKTERQPE
jgi:hypothetical protein